MAKSQAPTGLGYQRPGSDRGIFCKVGTVIPAVRYVCVSHAVVTDSVALWTIAFQAPLSMRFSRQEYWGGLPCSPPGDLPGSGTGPTSLMSLALVGRFFTNSITWEAQCFIYMCHLINMYQEPVGAGDGRDSFPDIGRSQSYARTTVTPGNMGDSE